MKKQLAVAVVGWCVSAAAVLAGGAPVADKAAWPFAITAAHRPGTYWWVPGSAFTKEDIDWNLRQLRDAGFGFVHIVPIYGARGAEARYIPYLSPEWMRMLDLTVRQAQALGLFVDMTTGSGWCFGGPDLPADAIDVKARYDAATNSVSLALGMKVKRAAPGGEGPMINPFSPRAMSLYLQRFDQAFDAAKPALPRAQYHDSFEYQANWSPELLDEFQRRVGYDLRAHLREFFDEKPAADPAVLARVKYDYRHVLAELHRESIQVWTDWAHRRGMVTRDQAHGSPANLLDVYAASDIPETEMFGAPEFPIPGFRRDPAMVRDGDSDPRICMLAASAAHVAHPPGRQLVTSESGTWLREHWHESLAHLKLELDLFFLAGVNQMLFHGTCYSPKDAPWPGWFFYAATQMNPRNSMWRDVPYLTGYISRCQSVLQAGQPANDVLVYWPIHDLWMDPAGTAMRLTVHRHEWMARQRLGEVADALLAKGYAFDFVSDRMIESLRVRDGRLEAPGGTYRAIVIPACTHLPEGTAARLAELAGRGVPIVFEREIPADVPGNSDVGKRRAKLAAHRAQLEQAGVIVAPDAVNGLARVGIAHEPMADAGLRFIRRRVGTSHWYFIANHTAKEVAAWIGLGVPFTMATRFDPMTGRSGRLPQRTQGTGAEIHLQLAPGESAILKADTADRPGPAWPLLRPAGEPVVLQGQWSVDFVEGGPALPAAYTTRDLRSWTGAADPKAQAFAGTARYTLRFSAPAPAADDWVLDLGDVRESARVRLNGHDAGALIAIPFRLLVGAYLQRGENTLEIEVTNLAANRVRDLERRKVDWRVMRDVNILSVLYKTFSPDQWPLEPSGLLGPVTLIPHDRRSSP
ncbi:MAG: glycosyl hydrolase [Opitutaceae bacterium]|nr:glycosyl hydrolase [Opitutaceae bacterium]